MEPADHQAVATPPPAVEPFEARRQAIAAMREAIAGAEQTAADTEVARLEAEANHAGKVAEALLAGAPKPPAKPAALTALQAADESTDAALELLRKRLTSLDADHTTITTEEVLTAARLVMDRRHAAKVAGMVKLREALAEVASNCADPIELAHLGFQDHLLRLAWSMRDASHLAAELDPLRERISSVGRSLDEHYDQMRREHEQANPIPKVQP